MNVDLSVVLDYFIPDSLNDVGAILLWVLLIVLAVLIIVNVRLVLQQWKTPQKEEQPVQTRLPVEQKKEPAEESSQSYTDIRTKVDQLIEINNL